MNANELESLARNLGGATRQGRGWLAFCPAHDNTKTPALSLDVGNNGSLLVTCHAGCDGLAVLDTLRGRGLIEGSDSGRGVSVDPAEAAKRERERKAEDAKRRRYALNIFDQAMPAEKTIVAAYLRNGRGIPLEVIPPSIRFHPKLKHNSGSFAPAMVALVEDAAGDRLGIHRTFLKKDGSGKADLEPSKLMMGPCRGGFVRLATDSETMAAAEGIESALSFMAATGIATLATLSTSGMKALDLPALPMAGALIIASDHDDAGKVAAGVLADRAAVQKRAVRIAMPPDLGDDFNDLLLKPHGDSTGGGE